MTVKDHRLNGRSIDVLANGPPIRKDIQCLILTKDEYGRDYPCKRRFVKEAHLKQHQKQKHRRSYSSIKEHEVRKFRCNYNIYIKGKFWITCQSKFYTERAKQFHQFDRHNIPNTLTDQIK